MQKKKGIFQSIVEFLFTSSSPEAEKKRALRQIAREIGKVKFKWYRPSSGDALPQMGRFFYEVYATVGAAQVILSKANTSSILKTIIIEASLSEKQRKIKANLTEEQLKERFRAENTKNLEAQIATELDAFKHEFTEEKSQQINNLYTQIEAFANFAAFDYYFVLKKFDSGIREHEFSYTPKCSMISAKYILEDLKDFAEVAYALPLNANWQAIFAIIKNYKGVAPVNLTRWERVVRLLHDVRKSNILMLIIRHISSNPNERIKSAPIHAKIVDRYVSELNMQTKSLVKQISQETKISQASHLLQQLFGYMPPTSINNYTPEASQNFQNKNFTGFTRTAELNYLNAFLLAYLNTDIYKIYDLCVVRAKWKHNEDSTVLSNNYHTLVELVGKIEEFDDSLDDYTLINTKLKTLLLRQEHDLEAKSQLETALKDVNRTAFSLVSTGFQSLLAVGKTLTALLEDSQKVQHSLVTNWEQIENIAGASIKSMLVEVCKKIYSIAMILHIYIQGEVGEEK